MRRKSVGKPKEDKRIGCTDTTQIFVDMTLHTLSKKELVELSLELKE